MFFKAQFPEEQQTSLQLQSGVQLHLRMSSDACQAAAAAAAAGVEHMQTSLEQCVSRSDWTNHSELTALVPSLLLGSGTTGMTQYYFLNLISTFAPQVLHNSANQRGLHPVVRWEGSCIVPHQRQTCRWWGSSFWTIKGNFDLDSFSPNSKRRKKRHKATKVAPTLSIMTLRFSLLLNFNCCRERRVLSNCLILFITHQLKAVRFKTCVVAPTNVKKTQRRWI